MPMQGPAPSELLCSLLTAPVRVVQEADRVPMYRVRFAAADIWEGNDPDSSDTVDVEVYQPWLEAASPLALDEQRTKRWAACWEHMAYPESTWDQGPCPLVCSHPDYEYDSIGPSVWRS